MNPTISVIVPCYNQAQFLDECLQSVLNQTYTNWECIIVNDGSPDNTKDVVERWLKKDSRFSYFSQTNTGLSSARNNGIKLAKGSLILALDADDYISNNYMNLIVQEFEKDQNLKIAYSRAVKFGEVNKEWNLQEYSLKALLLDNMIYCSAIFKKSDWLKVGGYDTNMIYGWEDWEFWLAILKDGGNVKQLDFHGFYYRVKKESMNILITGDKSTYSKNYICTKHADLYINEFGNFIELNHEISKKKNNLKNKKFVLNLFCSTFFGFTFFKKYK